MKESEVEIRSMNPGDLDAVCQLEQEIFPDPWGRASFLSSIQDNPRTEAYVMEKGGRLVGYYVCWHVAGESSLNNIAVASSFRKQGFGRRMLDHFYQRARECESEKLFLEVSTKNRPALTLYEEEGFHILRRIHHYYVKEQADAYSMMRSVKGTGGQDHV